MKMQQLTGKKQDGIDIDDENDVDDEKEVDEKRCRLRKINRWRRRSI